MNRIVALCLLTLASFCTSLRAQNIHPPLTAEQVAAIDRFVASSMQTRNIPGVALGVYSRGHLLLAKGYGMSNVELSVPVKPETVFQSGSVGKQFASAAIMMLVEENKINLDDSIVRYFPNAPETWKPILVKNLLTHTSGLPEYETAERAGPKGPFYMRLDFTEDEMVAKVEALPIDFKVGEQWDYRNTNYLLLGIIIHKVTGKFYADFLKERIFEPLGMTSTRLISEADIIPNRAAGYELHGKELRNQEWVSPTFNSTADGALYFNVLDIAKWDGALYGTTLLKQSSLDRMWTVYPLNDGKPNLASYGFGWMMEPMNGHKTTQHGGAWQGFTCFILRYPDDNLTVAVLANLAGGGPGMIAKVVAGMINPAAAQADRNTRRSARACRQFEEAAGPIGCWGRCAQPDVDGTRRRPDSRSTQGSARRNEGCVAAGLARAGNTQNVRQRGRILLSNPQGRPCPARYLPAG